ncbi:MAG: tetratricopeptide repeat protein [Clostridium sp.]|nr:tetratricopeptide repeat protein [Clostridium sp.]
MRTKRENGKKFRCAAALCAAALLLSGCGEPKKAREARLQGIEQMNQEQLEEAVVSFDTALKEADGVVDEFELDILKYRGEAEYRLGDYEAAVHTYEILAEVDGKKTEYLRCRNRAEVQLVNEKGLAFLEEGNGEDAVSAFEEGLALAEESGDEALMQEAKQLLSYNIGAAYEKQGEFAKALEIFQEYASAYGMTEKLEKEIAFLNGRIN